MKEPLQIGWPIFWFILGNLAVGLTAWFFKVPILTTFILVTCGVTISSSWGKVRNELDYRKMLKEIEEYNEKAIAEQKMRKAEDVCNGSGEGCGTCRCQ